MKKNVKLSAFLVANQLDLKGIKSFFELRTLWDSSSELFYHMASDKYQCYFNYGVVVFAGHTNEECQLALKTISQFQRNPINNWFREDYEISVGGSELLIEFERVVVDRLNHNIFRIAMFNVGQSVALDQYHQATEALLAEIRHFTKDLKNNGRLNINRRNMMKFIGRALNTQNEIAENIYIFDAPDLVWEDEYLDKLHKGLRRHFDLQARFNEIEYTLRIIVDNLTVFREILNQRQSSTLEWIIIALILVEVLNLVVSKVF